MTVSYRIREFPTFPIEKQIFHVPGLSIDGGFTVGGARITSPAPGGRSVLEIQPSLQINEFEFPISSWLMSKINGEIFRVRLAPTPQVLSARSVSIPWEPDTLWSNDQPWQGDLISKFKSSALEGSSIVLVDMSSIGPRLQPGHVIGHDNYTYKVDEVSYDENMTATIEVVPPIRKTISVNDVVFFRPYFLGSIANGESMRVPYDAADNGHIQLGNIIFNEVVI